MARRYMVRNVEVIEILRKIRRFQKVSLTSMASFTNRVIEFFREFIGKIKGNIKEKMIWPLRNTR